MRYRLPRGPVAAALVLAAAAALPTWAQTTYDYRGSSGGGGGFRGKSGVLLILEAAGTNPRNVDNVVATEFGGGVVLPVIPDWSDDVAGRFGVGYQWSSGARVMGTIWGFSTEVTAQGNAPLGRQYAFPIGPPVAPGLGDVGTAYSDRTELDAGTADIDFGMNHGLTEAFHMTWSVGLRYASYEETHQALYDGTYVADKVIQSDMFGARASVRGSYRWGMFSINGGMGVSFLSGKLEGRSGLSQSGLQVTGSVVEDDGRSGNILDFDINAVWHSRGDTVRLVLGWEQQTWRDLVADPVRNFPGTVAPLRDRDTVSFSGLKIGIHLTF